MVFGLVRRDDNIICDTVRGRMGMHTEDDLICIFIYNMGKNKLVMSVVNESKSVNLF